MSIQGQLAEARVVFPPPRGRVVRSAGNFDCLRIPEGPTEIARAPITPQEGTRVGRLVAPRAPAELEVTAPLSSAGGAPNADVVPPSNPAPASPAYAPIEIVPPEAEISPWWYFMIGVTTGMSLVLGVLAGL